MSIERGAPFYAQVADGLRHDIQAGRYGPGDQLPSERDLRIRFGVSTNTIRAAIVHLRAEGLVVSEQGRGVFVTEPPSALRRLDTDIATGDGFYTMLDRTGRRPATETTVDRAPATAEVAEWLGIAAGDEVVVRDRLLRTEGGPPVGIAVSYYPLWVVDAAPNLADPNISGMPTWLREAFGDTWSEDRVTSRLINSAEAVRLQMKPGSAVTIVKGTTRDQDSRVLHFIDKVTNPEQMEYGYRFGAIPAE